MHAWYEYFFKSSLVNADKIVIIVKIINNKRTNLLKEYKISIENKILLIVKVINKDKQNRTDFLFDIQLKLISEILKTTIKEIINNDSGIWGNKLNDSIEFQLKLIRSAPANTKYDTNNK